MVAASDYLEDKVLDHVLGIAAFEMPSGLYVALYTSATTDDGGGNEVTGGSYERKAVTFGVGAEANQRTNTASINFTNMPEVTVTHVALHDAAVLGNMLLHGPLTAPVPVAAGTTFTFAAGDLDVTLN